MSMPLSLRNAQKMLTNWNLNELEKMHPKNAQKEMHGEKGMVEGSGNLFLLEIIPNLSSFPTFPLCK